MDLKKAGYEMNKKNITIMTSIFVIAIIFLLLFIFGSKQYTVEFDSKGGTLVPSQKVKPSRTANRPKDPTREGYTFDNWYLNGLVYDFDTKISKNIKLEARWNEGSMVDKSLTINFNTGGGSSVASMSVIENNTITAPSNPTRDGYRFVEWQLDGKKFDFDTKIFKNMTLTAKWEKDDSVNSSGGKKVSVSLSSKSFSLQVGESKRLKATVKNSKKTVTWSSSNSNVASVDNKGNIRAIGAGKATITASVDGVSSSITVTVTSPSGGNNQGEQTTPTEPDKTTYTAVCEAISGSTLDQCEIKIKSSTGRYVSGTVHVEITTGASKTVQTGFTLGSKLFKNAIVVSVN